MTDRNAERTKCITAMVIASHREQYHNYTTVNGPKSWKAEPLLTKARWIAVQTAAFDALHNLVLVLRADTFNRVADDAFYAGNELRGIVASGDLTNAPKEKQ